MPKYLEGFSPVEEEDKQSSTVLEGFTPTGRLNNGALDGFIPEAKSSWSAADEARAEKYGRVVSRPVWDWGRGKKSFYEAAKDFMKDITPFRLYMSEAGRDILAGMPHELRNDYRTRQFADVGLLAMGGEGFVMRGVARKALGETMKAGGAAVRNKIIQNLEEGVAEGVTPRIAKKAQENQKYIEELYDDILIHPTTVKTPAQRQRVIDSVMGKDEKITLPLKYTKPVDRVDALQKANQKIINAQFKEDPFVKPISQKILRTAGLLKEGKKATRLGYTETSELLRKAKETGIAKQAKPGFAKTAEDLLDEKDIVYFHSGFPIDAKRLKDAVGAGKDLLKNVWWKPISEADMGWWERTVSLPHWLSKKYPQAKKLYKIQMARQDARADLTHTFLESVEPFLKLKGDDYKLCKDLLLLGDRESKVFTTGELLRAGASQPTIKGYQAVRETLDDVLRDYWKRAKDMGIPEDEIMKHRQNLGNIVGYFPRVRKGKYYVKAMKEGFPEQRIHFNNPIKGAKIRKDLIGEGYKIVGEGKVGRLPEEVYFQISPDAISQVIDVATQGFGEAVKKEIKLNMANIFKERGWMQHGLSRRDFVKGFETDNIKNVVFEYINGYSGFVTKIDAAKEFRKTLTDMAFEKGEKGIAAKTQPGLYQWSTKYVRDVMENADRFDLISGKIRAAFFYKYLGAVIKSGFVNLTQNAIGAAPRLSLETKFAYPKLSKAMVDIVRHYAPRGKHLAKEETEALRLALQHGWTREQYMKELMGHVSQYGSVPARAQKILGGPMAISERYNRQSTFLAAFRVFRNEKKLAFEQAVKKAGGVVEDSHFVYGKSNLPGAMRGGPTRKMLRTGYTFRTFTHNYINLLAHMSKKSPAAVAKSLAALGTLGGVSSIPFFKTVESVAQRYGYQPRSYIKDKLTQFGLGDKTNLALYGLPAILDVDLGGSIGIEMPGQRYLTGQDYKSMVVDTAIDVLGVPGSIAEDTWNAAEHLHSGDVYRAIEGSPITPTVVSNAMKAKRYATEGLTTRGGESILSDEMEALKLTPRQAVQKGIFGFQPVEQTEQYRKYAARKAESIRWNKKRKHLVNAFGRMAHRYGLGSKQADAVMSQIEKYNEQIPPYANEITSETLEGRLIPDISEKKLMLQEAIR